MNAYYNQNYSEEEIEEVLGKIKTCIVEDEYTISLNESRQDNIEFISEFNLRSEKIKRILLDLKVSDFCHTLKNMKKGFQHEVLYVFVPQFELNDSSGAFQTVNIYIKINIVKINDGFRTVVISFHKSKKEIEYLFK